MDWYRRARILEIVDRLGEATTSDVRRELEGMGEDFSRSLVRVIMLNLYRRYLLKRRRGLGHYVYSLTDRGRNRLMWFKKQGIL